MHIQLKEYPCAIAELCLQIKVFTHYHKALLAMFSSSNCQDYLPDKIKYVVAQMPPMARAFVQNLLFLAILSDIPFQPPFLFIHGITCSFKKVQRMEASSTTTCGCFWSIKWWDNTPVNVNMDTILPQLISSLIISFATEKKVDRVFSVVIERFLDRFSKNWLFVSSTSKHNLAKSRCNSDGLLGGIKKSLGRPTSIAWESFALKRNGI